MPQMVEQVSLEYREGGSDKVYHAQLLQTEDGAFEVTFQYGRRGAALATGRKTATPVDENTARKAYEKVVGEKVRKGYTAMASTGAGYTALPVVADMIPGRLPMLLNEIAEEALPALFADPRWGMSEKYDGRRNTVGTRPGEPVIGANRKGQAVAIPDVVSRSVQAVAEGLQVPQVLLDGERIGERFVVFDLLECGSRTANPDLRQQSYAERQKLLNELSGLEIAEVTYDPVRKRERFEALKAAGKEGVVFRLMDAPYVPGRPNSGGPALKFKFYATLTARVLKPHASKRSVSLELLDTSVGVIGRWVPVGNVTIPPNHAMPMVGDLVEIRYLYGYPKGSLYQPGYLGVRDDLDHTAALLSQVKYKPESEDSLSEDDEDS